MKIIIEQIKNFASFQEAQTQLQMITNAICGMGSSELDEKDAEVWVMALQIRLISLRTITDLIEKYHTQVTNNIQSAESKVSDEP